MGRAHRRSRESSLRDIPNVLADAMELAADHFAVDGEERATHLRRRIDDGIMALLDQLTLATRAFDRSEGLRRADAEIAMLRTHVAIAVDIAAMPLEHGLEIGDRLDTIGRQIGGWRRAMARETDD